MLVKIIQWSGKNPFLVLLCTVFIVLGGVVLISGAVGAGAYGSNPPLGGLFGVLTAIAYAGLDNTLWIPAISKTALIAPPAITPVPSGMGMTNVLP